MSSMRHVATRDFSCHTLNQILFVVIQKQKITQYYYIIYYYEQAKLQF